MNAPDKNFPAPQGPFTVHYPELGTGPVSTEPNRSQAFFELEKEKVFKKSWLNLGRDEDIPNPGDYMVKDVEILNASFIIVRGQDNTVRAFHNACPHRGNKVASGTGNTKGFACGFHGWTFDNQGALVFVPDEEQFFNFDKKDFCLKSVNCDVWEGFIFINIDPNPTETLDEWVGELKGDLAGYPFETMACLGRYKARVKANWKIVVDAFQEGYHVAHVHKRSIPDAFTGEDNPHCHISSVKLFDRNRRGSIYANPNHQPGPTEALAWKYGATLTQGATAEHTTLPRGVNPEKRPEWGFDFNVVWPNFRFDPGQGWYFADNFWPISVDESIYEIALYMPPPKNAGQQISQEFTRVLLRDAVREDLSTLEACQQAIMSGAMDTFVLSDMEVAVRHQYKVLNDIVNAD
ncbi:MAG: aromatic ring-hydroxylating dioxygenase subunit alpha [Gammaproteobacteria bacterium]|nr:aromatic ring-hydroxylating dioxygenase subunit alpha [Gammaproteobacteria bacterium]